jgi:hypothetical protein
MTDSELFTDAQGKIYLIPFGSRFILAQVGFGGDLGVFAGLYEKGAPFAQLNPDLLFRVHYGRVSPQKFHWIDAGKHPYKDRLSTAVPYVHSTIGSNECVLVTYGQEDIPVSCGQASQYEPMATWSHEHIVDRFSKSGGAS